MPVLEDLSPVTSERIESVSSCRWRGEAQLGEPTGPQVGDCLKVALLGVGVGVGDNRGNGAAGLRGRHCCVGEVGELMKRVEL